MTTTMAAFIFVPSNFTAFIQLTPITLDVKERLRLPFNPIRVRLESSGVSVTFRQPKDRLDKRGPIALSL